MRMAREDDTWPRNNLALYAIASTMMRRRFSAMNFDFLFVLVQLVAG